MTIQWIVLVEIYVSCCTQNRQVGPYPFYCIRSGVYTFVTKRVYIFAIFLCKYMEQLRKVDDMASYLHRLLMSQSMNIDIVHLSDHGMTSVTKARIIDLEKAMPSKGNYRIYSSTPVLQIVPEEGKILPYS